VLVPAGEGGVLDALPAADPVRLLVEAPVLAVDVAEDVGLQQGVVQRGVEDGLLVGGTATDADLTERPAPRVAGPVADPVERGAGRVLCAQVGLGVVLAHVRDADPHADLRAVGEAQVRPGTLARYRKAVRPHLGTAAGAGGSRRDGTVGPRADRAKRLVELGVEEQGVVAAPVLRPDVPAEVATGDR